IDHAAAAAATEDHGIRPAQNFDALQVVEVAVILNVIAHSVEKEVGRRTGAANDDLIAVVLALVSSDAGRITYDIAEAHQLLVSDLLLRHDGDRLRHIAQRRQSLGRTADGQRAVIGPDYGDRVL